MKKLTMRLPVFGFIVATRAALGFGAGLLLSQKFARDRRRKIGMTLVAIGAATTIPAVRALRSHFDESDHSWRKAMSGSM
ncbi:MAG TPA: hypothetical protein VGF24_01590 [Vicinamibacterales bacterium]|jgi:hypothetical protein